MSDAHHALEEGVKMRDKLIEDQQKVIDLQQRRIDALLQRIKLLESAHVVNYSPNGVANATGPVTIINGKKSSRVVVDNFE